MIYDFDVLPERRGTDSDKWNSYEPDVLPLWVADMDFRSPEPVIRALQERVAHGVFGYPRLLPRLKEVIIERLAQLYRWEVGEDDIILLPGVVTGFNLACHALAAPEGGVLVQTPVYPPILHAAYHTGCLSQAMELTRCPDGSYVVDWQTFEAKFTPQTRLFILCNPHNPVGKVFSRQELLQLAEICLTRGVVICSDEIHSDLVYPGSQHIPIASLSPEIAQNTITLMAPSKTYNIAGLQCSFAVIQNPQLRQRFQQARQGLVPWVNLMGLVAAQAAYEYGQEWLDQLLVYLRGNRDLVYEYVNHKLPGVTMGMPEGTYLAWLDCRYADIADDPYHFFLEKARVALNDGATFGPGGKGFVRLNFGCPRPLLLEALERMRAALCAKSVEKE